VAYLSPTPGWRSDLAAARLVEAPALALARTLGLEGDALARPVRELSTGQQQRLHLARLLAAPHDVLLLDEPCSALDVGARDAAEALIAAAAGRGARVLLSSHDPGAVARLGAGHWRIAAGTLEVS
jgi:ATPase subunit of ABC transporter with duplicated ATPase domains